MKRILALTVALCCLLAALPVLAETATTDTVAALDAFSFTKAAGSYYIPGEAGDVVLFTYYPEFESGNLSLNVNCTSEDNPYDPAAMSASELDEVAKALVDGMTELYESMGAKVSFGKTTWSAPFTADGVKGITLSYSVTLSMAGQTAAMAQAQSFFNLGGKLYTFTATGTTEAECTAALNAFFAGLTWN